MMKQILLRVPAVFAEIGFGELREAAARVIFFRREKYCCLNTRSIQTSIGNARSRSYAKSITQFAIFGPTPGNAHNCFLSSASDKADHASRSAWPELTSRAVASRFLAR